MSFRRPWRHPWKERAAADPGAGQEIWSDAARRLVEAPASQDAGTRSAIRSLLAQLGDEDFARIRRAPPLLYHNDLHATVRRYYWSEDVGYALWLRLYVETARRWSGSVPLPGGSAKNR